jgi:peptidyl-tRNA hydrolase
VSATKLDIAAQALDAAQHEVKRLYKQQRLAELEGRFLKKWDGQGLHPASVAVGRVLALRELYPELADTHWDPLTVKFRAEMDAQAEFADKLALVGPDEAFVREMR